MADKDDDDDWLEALAGRSGKAIDPMTAKEAKAVRDAIASLRAANFDVERGLQQLLARLPERHSPRPVRRWFSFWQPGMQWAMAAVLALGLGLGLLLHEGDDSNGIRSRGPGGDSYQTIRSGNVEGTAAQISKEMEAL